MREAITTAVIALACAVAPARAAFESRLAEATAQRDSSPGFSIDVPRFEPARPFSLIATERDSGDAYAPGVWLREGSWRARLPHWQHDYRTLPALKLRESSALRVEAPALTDLAAAELFCAVQPISLLGPTRAMLSPLGAEAWAARVDAARPGGAGVNYPLLALLFSPGLGLLAVSGLLALSRSR